MTGETYSITAESTTAVTTAVTTLASLAQSTRESLLGCTYSITAESTTTISAVATTITSIVAIFEGVVGERSSASECETSQKPWSHC